MRTAMLLPALIALSFTTCGRTQSGSSQALNLGTSASLLAPTTKPDFATQIKPIFEARCQPCHFPGGKVYDRMPFDRPETITRLGTKLFTRIKDQNEQRLIREFLGQP